MFNVRFAIAAAWLGHRRKRPVFRFDYPYTITTILPGPSLCYLSSQPGYADAIANGPVAPLTSWG